jgi:hypothetical protein
MRLSAYLIAHRTLLSIVVLAIALSQQPSFALAKTVIPVALGEPTDTTEGPAPGPGKGSTKDLSSRVTVLTGETLGQHSGVRLLANQDRYLFTLWILRYLWR